MDQGGLLSPPLRFARNPLLLVFCGLFVDGRKGLIGLRGFRILTESQFNGTDGALPLNLLLVVREISMGVLLPLKFRMIYVR